MCFGDLSTVAKAIEGIDFNPAPKKTFVANAAARFVAAILNRGDNQGIAEETKNGLAIDAVKLAEQIWEQTRKMSN